MQDYEIGRSEKDAFNRDGHILLRDIASSEIVRFAPVIREAAYRHKKEERPLDERDTYGKAFLQVMNLWRRDENVREFVFNKKFAQTAADLLGVEKVRLYHDQALFKEPLGGHTPWHQDQYYWPLDTDKMVTIWMPLVDIDQEMGMVKFATGSHKKGAIGSLQISDESEEAYDAYIAGNSFPIAKAGSMRAGDATFHLGWTIHGADGNKSPERMREAMTIIYFADGARISPLKNKNQEADLNAWLGGRKSGEIADCGLNPILN